jgi:hypothetical protein
MVNVEGGTSQFSIWTFEILGPFRWIWALESVLTVMFSNDENEMMVFYLQPSQLLLDYVAGLYENSMSKSPYRLLSYNNWRRGQRYVRLEPPKVRASYSKSWACLRRQTVASDAELVALELGLTLLDLIFSYSNLVLDVLFFLNSLRTSYRKPCGWNCRRAEGQGAPEVVCFRHKILVSLFWRLLFLWVVLHDVTFNVTATMYLWSSRFFSKDFTRSTVLKFGVKTPVNKKNSSSLILKNLELKFEPYMPNLIWMWGAQDPK